MMSEERKGSLFLTSQMRKEPNVLARLFNKIYLCKVKLFLLELLYIIMESNAFSSCIYIFPANYKVSKSFTRVSV